ncbi:hypothetical protein [Cellulosilyticum sp. I15G10I2]|uniref:hypothetical protein n=1 Tax=Cellulosilyticum sp. I15G10I2 TaxID=1892843 RepID=UPI00085BCBDF|nr:hypothetical protein [Cellulosilyticum sp. I15G10I2]
MTIIIYNFPGNTDVRVELILAIKYILTLQGIDTGKPQRPFSELTKAHKIYVEDVLNKNLIN